MRKRYLAFWLLGVSGAASAALPVQAPGPVIAQVESLLHERVESYPGTAQITVDAPRITNQTACDDLQASISGEGALRSRMSVRVRCATPQAWSLYVQASVRILGHYFVANHTIAPGQILSLDDLDTREGDLLRNPRAIIDPVHIVGFVATRRIRSGSEIRSTALRDPQSIERGQAVRTVARGSGFVATGEGTALESGAPGMQIQVRSSSGQIITGTVIDAQTVQVMM